MYILMFLKIYLSGKNLAFCYLGFGILWLEHPCIREHEDLEGILATSHVTDVNHGQAVQLIQTTVGIFHWATPVTYTTTVYKYSILRAKLRHNQFYPKKCTLNISWIWGSCTSFLTSEADVLYFLSLKQKCLISYLWGRCVLFLTSEADVFYFLPLRQMCFISYLWGRCALFLTSEAEVFYFLPLRQMCCKHEAIIQQESLNLADGPQRLGIQLYQCPIMHQVTSRDFCHSLTNKKSIHVIWNDLAGQVMEIQIKILSLSNETKNFWQMVENFIFYLALSSQNCQNLC